MKQFVTIVMKDPSSRTMVGFAGGNIGLEPGPHVRHVEAAGRTRQLSGSSLLAIVSKISADQVIGRLRRKLAVVPGATLYMQAAAGLHDRRTSSQAQYQYTLQGENLDDLNYWSPRLLQKLRSLPELRDVNTDQQDKGSRPT